MPTFRSIAEMRAYMLSRFDVALYQETYVIEEIFRYYLRLFYDEYTPNSYRRTLMLLQSFHISPIGHSKDGAYFEGWFDGAWFTGDWSDELIMLVNLTGNHGGIQAGTDVWGEGTREIALTYADDLKDYLRSAGIPVI